MPCTDCTSRVSSPYQPAASHSFGPARLYGPALYCLNCPAANGVSPTTVANWFASALIVGDAYASTIATVWPAPVFPELATP